MSSTPTPPGTAEPEQNPYLERWVEAYFGPRRGRCGDWKIVAGPLWKRAA